MTNNLKISAALTMSVVCIALDNTAIQGYDTSSRRVRGRIGSRIAPHPRNRKKGKSYRYYDSRSYLNSDKY
jgi:hypothetical protein